MGTKKEIGQWQKCRCYTKLLIPSSAADEHIQTIFFLLWSTEGTTTDSSSWEKSTEIWFIPSVRTPQESKGVELTSKQKMCLEPRWRRRMVLAGEIQSSWQDRQRELIYLEQRDVMFRLGRRKIVWWEVGARREFCGDHWQTICREAKVVCQTRGTLQTFPAHVQKVQLQRWLRLQKQVELPAERREGDRRQPSSSSQVAKASQLLIWSQISVALTSVPSSWFYTASS